MAKNIEKVSDEARASIRSLSAYSLPTSPSARGKTPDDIKKAIYEPVIGETNNVLNELDRVVDEANAALSEINAGIGEVSALTTDERTLAGAINEHDREIGNASSLTTSESTLVGAINEHDEEIGSLDELRSDTRTSLVDAINRVTDLIAVYPFNEDMSGHEHLQTTSKTLVGAVNETKARVDRNTADIEQNCTDIGNLKSETAVLAQSVGAHDCAIGSLDARVAQNESKIGSGNLATINKNIISAINENRGSIINVKANLDYVKSEVSGTAKNYVLDTFADFIRLLNGESVLPNEYDFGYLSTGDNILIVEHNVPDFWVEYVPDDEERFKNAGTYTYDGVEYSLGVRYEDGAPAVIFHILESDYTVIAGHATIASESASDALKYANNASDSADRAEAAEVNARKSEDRTQVDANAAKESKEIAVLAAEEAKTAAEFVSANVLKGQAQGNPIVLDDVLPVEHEIACKVSKKNHFNQQLLLERGFTLQADGSYQGTIVGNPKVVFENTEGVQGAFTVSYTGRHIGAPYNESGFIFWVKYTDGTSEYKGSLYRLDNETRYTTGTTNADKTVKEILLSYGVPHECNVRDIQIEVGATATPYAPYIESVEGVEVTVEETDEVYLTDAEGNVSIPSGAPKMTIVADGRVVLDASYNRDINALNTALDLTAVEAKINAAKQENAAKIASTNQAIGAQDNRITAIEKWIGKQGDLIVESDTSGNINIPSGVHKYALILENHGHESAYRDEYYYWEVVGNYPQKIVTDTGDTLFEMPSDCWRLSDFGIQGNYICFEDDKVYYKQTAKQESYYYEPTEGERMIEQYSDTTSIVALAEPIITDVTEMFSASPIIDLSGCKYITVVPKHTEEEVKQMSIDSGSYDYEYSMPTVKIAFEV